MPETGAFKGIECSGNTNIFFRIQVLPNAIAGNTTPEVVLSDGKNVIGKFTLEGVAKNK